MDKRLYTRRDARIGVVLPKALRDEVAAVAEAENTNISTIVRIALIDYLKKIQSNCGGNQHD